MRIFASRSSGDKLLWLRLYWYRLTSWQVAAVMAVFVVTLIGALLLAFVFRF